MYEKQYVTYRLGSVLLGGLYRGAFGGWWERISRFARKDRRGNTRAGGR